MTFRLGAAAFLAAAAALPVTASGQQRCSQETLSVRGTPVTIGYCIAAPPRSGAGEEVLIPVQASYTAPGGSFGRAEELRFIAGEGSSRVVENLRLGPLGLGAQTLHLTLVYAGGVVRIEGALLTPGAITVK
ncbi:MAG TPA: hypothetical protein VK760_15745 [Candidatus Acidoferrales bacterium]|jgi:hypothetical protein|nr:hypothetical protein [Candidatus Acidoferrales bacterium]